MPRWCSNIFKMLCVILYEFCFKFNILCSGESLLENRLNFDEIAVMS